MSRFGDARNEISRVICDGGNIKYPTANYKP
jgi:hypothetical protein